MRPLSIELKGFGAFRADTLVDLADTELFALVGPTGSGKSTVIDAMCFALYGSVFRLDDKRRVGTVVSLGEPEARVRLRFELEGETYVLVRVVKAAGDGLGSTKEVRLERVSDGHVLAATAREMDGAKNEPGAVAQLLRMNFEQFTRCVVLPQGAFAQFLHSGNTERQELLASLIDLSMYERVRARAVRRATAADRELATLLGKLSELAPHDGDTLTRLADRLEQLTVLSAHTSRLVNDADAVLREQAAIVTQIATHQADIATLRRIRVPDGLATLDQRRTRADQAVQAAQTRIRDTGVQLEQAAARVQQLPSGPAIDRILGLIEAIEQADGILAGLDANMNLAQGTLDQSATDAASATNAEHAARIAVEEGQQANRAHALAVGLHVGDACPVCERLIETPLAAGHDSDLTALQARRTQAEQAVKAAAKALTTATTELATIQARAATTRERRAADAAMLAPLTVGLPSTPQELTDLKLQASDAAKEEAAARAADTKARQTEEQERQTFAAAEQALESARTGYQVARDPWAASGAPVLGSDLTHSWTSLVTWAAQHAKALAETSTALQVQADALTQTPIATYAQLRTEADHQGFDVRADHVTNGERLAKDCTALNHELSQERSTANTRLEDARKAAQRAAALEASKAGWEEAKTVASTLARRLDRGQNGFPQWLLAASLASLVERASVTLYELSGNQFSLTLDGQADIVVIDHTCADLHRPVRTLSGGETFEASLALALALAAELASGGETGGKQLPIDALFLDEGFGTLDPENLDKVAASIETLGGQGRLVGIVTHVVELAERMPVRFRVSKTPSGSVVEREVN